MSHVVREGRVMGNEVADYTLLCVPQQLWSYQQAPSLTYVKLPVRDTTEA